MDRNRIRHEFVEFIPAELSEGVLYISIEYATAVHLCISGCGKKVVTPLTPTDWALIFDGETASLTPSIGNWGFECRSHYWIKKDRVVWGAAWSRDQIAAGRQRDALAKQNYYTRASEPGHTDANTYPKPGLFVRLRRNITAVFERQRDR
ncbi:MAG: DUF6527 family protein [Acidimicrobiia bacterium]